MAHYSNVACFFLENDTSTDGREYLLTVSIPPIILKNWQSIAKLKPKLTPLNSAIKVMLK
jgi:hypothetical protein